MTRPSHSSTDGLSPRSIATAIIVTCTEPNKINAPVPAVSPRYANEKHTAYANKKNADGQFPKVPCPMSRVPSELSKVIPETWDFWDLGRETNQLITINATAPDTSLTAVNPAASASSPRNAKRHNIEFNANATRARVVYRNTFKALLTQRRQGAKTQSFIFVFLCGFATLR